MRRVDYARGILHWVCHPIPTPAPEVLMPPPCQPSPSSLRQSPRLNTPAPQESGDPIDIDA